MLEVLGTLLLAPVALIVGVVTGVVIGVAICLGVLAIIDRIARVPDDELEDLGDEIVDVHVH